MSITRPTLKDLMNDYTDVHFFSDDGSVYVRDTKARKIINKLLGSSFVAVYRTRNEIDKTSYSEESFDLDNEHIYCVRPDGKVILFTNSEWGSILTL